MTDDFQRQISKSRTIQHQGAKTNQSNFQPIGDNDSQVSPQPGSTKLALPVLNKASFILDGFRGTSRSSQSIVTKDPAPAQPQTRGERNHPGSELNQNSGPSSVLDDIPGFLDGAVYQYTRLGGLKRVESRLIGTTEANLKPVSEPKSGKSSSLKATATPFSPLPKVPSSGLGQTYALLNQPISGNGNTTEVFQDSRAANYPAEESTEYEELHFWRVDTGEALQSMLSVVVNNQSQYCDLFLDAEGGHGHGRNCSLNTLQTMSLSANMSWLVDFQALGAKVFYTRCQSGTQPKLGEIFEDPTIPLIWFDVWGDWDSIFCHYGVHMRYVIDLQITEMALRQGPREARKSLDDCL